ncbi:MAG: ferrous iron transport protein B [Anaerolineales bacterium]|nr:ferrous iron transport protein B [Anaerolineales bacterium]
MSAATIGRAGSFRLDYGHDLEAEIDRLAAAFHTHGLETAPYPARWLALKLLEAEADVLAQIAARPGGAECVELARERAAHLEATLGDEVGILTADRRYGFISGVTRQVLRQPRRDRVALSQRIDDVVTHRWLGLPIFFAVMYVVFRLVIDVSAPFLDWVDAAINGPVARWLGVLLASAAAPGWLRALVIDGALAGVGGVLVFVPGLMVLFFFLALLEDSGYLARAAFVMDRFMRVVGLHGKSFIPMVLGFGCAVPAIYATRTLAGRRDRLLTALLVPLMSCSARLPVYLVFGLAFFGPQAGTLVWLLYAVGIVAALGVGLLFTRTVLKPDRGSAFVLELPPYRRPALRGLLLHTWEHTRAFVRKAGTVILGVSVALWLLLNLPWGVSNQRDSYFGQVSAAIAPVFTPLGFGRWEATGALIAGFAAKEIVVSTLSQIYVGGASEAAEPPVEPPTVLEEVAGIGAGFVEASVAAGKTLLSIIPGVRFAQADAAPEDTALSVALRQNYTPLAALALLVFVLLYVPCVATLGAIKHEFGWQWAAMAAAYQTAIAWGAAFIVYQGGRLVGLG